IKARHETDIMLHCGDSELEMDDPVLEGFYTVGGNCDFDNRYPNEQSFEFKGLSFLILHGHRHYVKHDLTTLALYASEADASVICFGHSHIPGALVYHNQLFINPGSIYKPKLHAEKSYAILEWDSNKNIQVHFYNLDGEPLEFLDYKGVL